MSRCGATPRAYALGFAVAAALAAAIAVASANGSAVRAGAAERLDTWPVMFLVLLVSAFLLYLAALVLLHARRAYGRIVASHNRNPFTVAPARFPHDPATRAVAPAWRRQVSVYGPAFAFASAAVGDLSKRSAEVASLLFRVTAAIAGVGATLLVATLARRKAYAAAFVGWNPLVAVSFAGGGHNDAWMLALMLVALALVARRRDVAGGACWILAAAIKAPALAILPLQLARTRRGVWVGASVAAVAVGSLATAAFGTAWITSASPSTRWHSKYGLTARLEQLAVPRTAAQVIPLVLLGVGALWLARQARRGQPRLALGASLLLVTSPWVLPVLDVARRARGRRRPHGATRRARPRRLPASSAGSALTSATVAQRFEWRTGSRRRQEGDHLAAREGRRTES